MKITLLKFPGIWDWGECRRRALVTVRNKKSLIKKLAGELTPSSTWKHRILEARHSPIRFLQYSFLIEDIPSNIATHLVRHVHAQPYVGSLRNDRQNDMDGDEAPRNTPVNMILDVNAEELMVIANKRLCTKASPKTREVVAEMCRLAQNATPELDGLLVPMCEYHGGVCHEMDPCGKNKK